MRQSERIFYHAAAASMREGILRDGLRPVIGRNARAAGEASPAVYLFPDWESLEHAILNWLPDMLGNDFVIFEITLDQGFEARHCRRGPGCEWEVTCDAAVPPGRIREIEA